MTKDASGIAVQPVVMAGGSGTRLWPLSRAGYPKQFLVLDDSNRSLLQQAVQRLVEIADDDLLVAAPLVVGNEEHRFLILDQLREIRRDPAAVLLEPAGRNTAPALTLAALAALDGGADPVLAVTPADQTVTDPAAFSKTGFSVAIWAAISASWASVSRSMTSLSGSAGHTEAAMAGLGSRA